MKRKQGSICFGFQYEFQFLIGTVKRISRAAIDFFNPQVSIPYRYCEKCNNNLPDSEAKKVSIPYRYCEKFGKIAKSFIRNNMFQFLIGTVKSLVK